MAARFQSKENEQRSTSIFFFFFLFLFFFFFFFEGVYTHYLLSLERELRCIIGNICKLLTNIKRAIF